MTSLRERAKMMNRLTILLKGLEGCVTTVELRNESTVRGRIESVDSSMNTSLLDAVYTSADGQKQLQCESFYVQGKNIRYVQIPDEVNIIKTIENELGSFEKQSRHTDLRKEKPPHPSPLDRKLEKKQQQKKKLDSAVEEMKANLAKLS